MTADDVIQAGFEALKPNPEEVRGMIEAWPVLAETDEKDHNVTKHRNRTNYRYFKVSPRGFDNEVIYFRVPLDKVNEVNQMFAHYEDGEPGRYANWSDDKRARMPGVAVDWADRAYAGFLPQMGF